MARISATLRNTRIRAMIKKTFGMQLTRDQIRAKLINISLLSKRDINIVLSCYDEGSRRDNSSSYDRLKNQILDADYAELYEHISNNTKINLTKWIIDIMKEVITQVKDNPILTQMIAPCSAASHAPYCSKSSKLMIITKLETLADILASDLQNPMRRGYIFARGSSPESRAYFADFSQRTDEVIIIRAAPTIRM
jgi:hypothetical protein